MVGDLSSLFKTKTDDSSDIARLYVEGLLTETSRKNMERLVASRSKTAGGREMRALEPGLVGGLIIAEVAPA